MRTIDKGCYGISHNDASLKGTSHKAVFQKTALLIKDTIVDRAFEGCIKKINLKAFGFIVWPFLGQSHKYGREDALQAMVIKWS